MGKKRPRTAVHHEEDDAGEPDDFELELAAARAIAREQGQLQASDDDGSDEEDEGQARNPKPREFVNNQVGWMDGWISHHNHHRSSSFILSPCLYRKDYVKY